MSTELGNDMKSDSLKNLTPEDLQRLELLSRVGKRINTPDSFNDALQAVLDAVVDMLEAERGALFLADERNCPQLNLAVDRAADREGEFRYSHTVIDKVWKELTPLAVLDAQGHVEFASAQSIQTEGIRSVVCVPMVGGKSTLGLIYLDNRLSNAFTGSDLQMLDIIADLAATALERARFFDALQSLNDKLEATVTERTQEAEQARAVAERATEAKSLFLANMSHELRTPLNGVLGLTEDLLRDEATPSLRLRLEQIGFSARSLAALVNGILDFSKIESGHVELDVHSFLLEDVLKTVLATVAYSAQEKGVELVVVMGRSVPVEVEGDSTRLKQILINLLANAVKFTETGWVKLVVSTEQEGTLDFAVCDSGIGIAADKLSLIFEPFSQADTSTTRQFGGTGLGLSICHSLTKLLGGDLKVESRIDVGSKFYFGVPLLTKRHYQPPESLDGLSIWVEDSDGEHRTTLMAMLLSWGVKVSSEPQGCQLGIRSTSEPVYDFPCLRLVSNYEMRHQKTVLAEDTNPFMLRPVLRGELATALLTLLERPDIVAVSRSAKVDDYAIPTPPVDAVLLIAEDHEINQLVTRRMVESWGYRCQFASSGVDVVRLFSQQRPHLILMDIEMPEVDGYAASRQIRGLEVAQGLTDFLPIVAVTAHLGPDLRIRCLEAGMDDLLDKPLSRPLLASRLRLWEQVLEDGQLRHRARLQGHKELRVWSGHFLSEIHSALSTLSLMVERDGQSVMMLTAGRLERLAFGAGLTHWGGRLVNWRTGRDQTPFSKILSDFMQEWKALAPTLLHTNP